MKNILFILLTVFVLQVDAQETVAPAKAHQGVFFISHATIHVGNGTIIQQGTIKIKDDKIESVGTDIAVPDGAIVIDATGQEVYPGLILSTSTLGLNEVGAVKATNDTRELGELNPDVRAIVAYNTDSKVINTLRSNGILLANIVPEGSFVAGSSSVVQLDAWNWEDALYLKDGGIHIFMPSMQRSRWWRFFASNNQSDPYKEGLAKIEKLKTFFKEAKAYAAVKEHEETNLKYESVKGLFDQSQTLFVHANNVKQILSAIDFVKEFHFKVVLVGAEECYRVAPLLKENNMAVILLQPHQLPDMADDDIDQPYKNAAVLQKAGVLFAISDEASDTRGRNLPFNAGTAATYGLTKEEALAAITLNAAKILNIADKTGSLEAGKDANIVISKGDILDMRKSIISRAFIQGRQIDLTNKQTLLYEKYMQKYNLK